MDDFEGYLMKVHMQEYVGTDDNSVDAFVEWSNELPFETLACYADLYACEYAKERLKGLDNGLNGEKLKEAGY